jgi:muramoyltetrapeptide carboxypeptidase
MLKPLPRDHRFTIGLPLPMGHLQAIEPYRRAVAHFKNLGHSVVEDPHLLQKHDYHAAPAAERLAVLQGMLDNPAIDLIMPVRGGYGMTHLLPALDLSQAANKRLIGYSDFTALNLAALKQGLLTFAGPMAAGDFGGDAPDLWAQAQCWDVLTSLQGQVSVNGTTGLQPNSVTGTLWGTNLSLLAHCAGTPFMPEIKGGILVIEDIGEEPYALDRALMQLWHAGIVQAQSALIFATFNGYDLEKPAAKAYPLERLIDNWQARLNLPVLAGFPFGHCALKATLPIGAMATLTIAVDGYQLAFTS